MDSAVTVRTALRAGNAGAAKRAPDARKAVFEYPLLFSLFTDFLRPEIKADLQLLWITGEKAASDLI